jgi:hypothetical protein
MILPMGPVLECAIRLDRPRSISPTCSNVAKYICEDHPRYSSEPLSTTKEQSRAGTRFREAAYCASIARGVAAEVEKTLATGSASGGSLQETGQFGDRQ